MSSSGGGGVSLSLPLKLNSHLTYSIHRFRLSNGLRCLGGFFVLWWHHVKYSGCFEATLRRQPRIQVDSRVYYALSFVIKGCVSLHYINLEITRESLQCLSLRHLSLRTCLRGGRRGESGSALLSISPSPVRSLGNNRPSKTHCAMTTA